MTAGAIATDLARLLDSTTALLLDFDGPVCPIFEEGRNAAIAEQMRGTLLDELGVTDFPPHIASTYDPLHVLQFAYERDPGTPTSRVEDTFIAGEVAAAAEAKPTPGGHETIVACHETGRPVVIVSNNSQACIEAYLTRHQLDGIILGIVGRAYARPDLMKPNPTPVHQALAQLGTKPESCVLVGDSVSDVTVSLLTNVHPIGYAKRPSRMPELAEAGASIVVDSMRILADAIRTASPPS
jgi:beta-phosphoglucomutase-like phosphatase (HAD superfamily)